MRYMYRQIRQPRAVGAVLSLLRRQASCSATEGMQSAHEWFGDPHSPETHRISRIENKRVVDRLGRDVPRLYEKIRSRCHLFDEYSSPQGQQDADAKGDSFGSYEYFQDRVPGQSNVVVRRRRVDSVSAGSEVVVNINKLSERLPQPVSLVHLRPNLSQRFIGFILEAGEESKKVFYVKDMSRSAVCEISFEGPDSVDGFISSFEWGTSDASDVLYVVFDEDHVRPSMVYRYDLEVDRLFRRDRFRALNITGRKLQLILRDPNPACFVNVYRTKDDKLMIINSNTKTSSEAIVMLPSSSVTGETRSWQVFTRRVPGLQYYITHCNGHFYVMSNYEKCTETNGKNGNDSIVKIGNDMRLFRCRHSQRPRGGDYCHPSTWELVWPLAQEQELSGINFSLKGDNPFGLPREESGHGDVDRSAMSVEDIDFSEHSAVLYGHRRGVSTICKIDLETGIETNYTPELADKIGNHDFQVFPSSNDHKEAYLRFDLSAPLLPGITGEIDLKKSKTPAISWSNCISVPGVPKFTTSDYDTEHTSVPVLSSLDNEEKRVACQIPLTIISPKLREEPGPFLLLGYGSYGASLPMAYRPELVVLLESGWSIGFAHVRGGGEMGQGWHLQGKKNNKWNTFNDFSACARYLIENGHTVSKLLCAEFESAGGLIGGVMVNHFPELFAGIILRNPFLDVYNTILDPDQPLTAHEFDEWGHPNKSEELKYIGSYCPYTNIAGGEVPAANPLVYVSVGLHDNNVAPWETLRWVDKLRRFRAHKSVKIDNGTDMFTSDDPGKVFFRIISDAGHSGPRSLEDRYNERALEMAFLEHAISSGDGKVM